VIKRVALWAVLAVLAGLGNAYLTIFMKDELGWRGSRNPNFSLDFWLVFVPEFAMAYLTLWWHRKD